MERCKFPQRGPGRSPGRKRILTHLELSKRLSWQHRSVVFMQHKLLFFLGGGFEPVNPPLKYGPSLYIGVDNQLCTVGGIVVLLLLQSIFFSLFCRYVFIW